MIQKIERMHIIDQLPDGRYKVSGIEGTYTKAELERLKAVILADSAGIHLCKVISMEKIPSTYFAARLNDGRVALMGFGLTTNGCGFDR